jgi:hypothetical protein
MIENNIWVTQNTNGKVDFYNVYLLFFELKSIGP